MELQSRDNSIHKFQTNDKIRVMISTYKVGGIGLNLTAANKCILLDLWWNEAVEQQVSDEYTDQRFHFSNYNPGLLPRLSNWTDPRS